MHLFAYKMGTGRAVAWLLGTVLVWTAAVGVVGMAAAQGAAVLMERAEAAFTAKRTYADGEQALSLFEQVITADAGNVLAHLRVAELHYWLGEVVEDGEALPLLEQGMKYALQAVELDNNDPEAHYWVAILTGRIGEERGILQSLFMVKDIMAALERTLELDPNHAGAHLVASQVYRKAPGWPLSIGDKKKAIEHGEEAVRLGPDKTLHVLNLAEAYLHDRKRDAARGLLQQVLDMPLTSGEEVTSQMDKDRAAQLLAGLK